MVRIVITGKSEENLIRRDIAAFRAFVERAFGGTFNILRKNWRRLIRMESKLDRALTILEDLRDLINRVDLENLENRIVTRISADIAAAIAAINANTDARAAEIMLKLTDMDDKLDELLRLLRGLNIPDFGAEFAELRRIMADIARDMADKHDVRTILDAIARLDIPLHQLITDVGALGAGQAAMGRDIQTIMTELRTHAAELLDFRRDAMAEFSAIRTRLNDIWDLLLHQYGPQLTTMNATLNQVLGIVQGLQQGGQAPPANIDIHDLIGDINNTAENANLLLQEQQIKALLEACAAAFAEAQSASIAEAVAAAESAAVSAAAAEAAALANAEAIAAQNQTIEAHLTAVAEALAILIAQGGGSDDEQQQIINNYNIMINLIANIVIIINGGGDPDDPTGSLTAAYIHSWKQRGGKKAIENKKVVPFEDEDLDLFGVLFGKADPNLEYRWYATDTADPAGNELQTFNAGTINGTNDIMHETDITIPTAFLVANNQFWVHLYVKDSQNNEHVYTIEVETKQRAQLGEPEFEIKPDWHVDRENSVIIAKETGFFFFIINTKPNSVGTIGWRVRVQDEANQNVARQLRLSINNPFVAGPGQMSDDQRYYKRTIKYISNIRGKRALFRVSGSITIPLSLVSNIVSAPEEEREALIETMLRRRFFLKIDIGKWDPTTSGRNGRIIVPSPTNYVEDCTLKIRPSREDVQRAIQVLNQKLQILGRKINTALDTELRDLKVIKNEIFDADAIQKLMAANQAGGVFRERAAIDAFKDVGEDREFQAAIRDFKSKLEVSEDIEHLIQNVFVQEAAAEEEVIGRIKELLGIDRELERYEERRIKQVAKDFMKIVKKRNRELRKAIDKINELNSVFENIILLMDAIEADDPDEITNRWMTVLGELNIHTAELSFKKAYQKILRMRTFIKNKIEKVVEISEQELYEVENLQNLTHEFT
jgi:hypothetical protein